MREGLYCPNHSPDEAAQRRQAQARFRGGQVTRSRQRKRKPGELAKLSFHASLAVADLFAQFAPGAQVATKWPNDALLNGKKAAGILLENFGPGGGCKANLAIGIGINLAHHPDPSETRWPPTSLNADTGIQPDFMAALTVLADRLAHWPSVPDFTHIRPMGLARATPLRQRIEARLPDRTLTGTFEDVDADGALVLRTTTGVQRIAAADIFFPE